MFIVFEGIDGSGKTTISNRVCQRLRAGGVSVTHVREGGTFASSAAQAIRELGRDARNLMLTPLVELLLYVARDGQSLEEMILPAIGTTDVVIADRFLYSAQLLATAGRGLPPAMVDPIIAPIAARLRPDLAILVDAPPDVAKARRRVSKLGSNERKPSSRKGLAGGGLQVRLRQAHLALAESQPELWLVVDNHETDLGGVVDAVCAAITTSLRDGVAAGLNEGRRRLPAAPPPAPPGLATTEDARMALLEWVDRRAALEPDLAAYVLAGCRGDDVMSRRQRLSVRAPLVVAHGLGGLDDPASWRLREALCERTPEGVARSLAGLAGPEAARWRRRLADRAPHAVAISLHGLDDEDAWAMREQLRPLVPQSVATSIGGLTSARADAARRRWLAALGDGGHADYLSAKATAKMFTGVHDDTAWRARQMAFELAPVEAIASIKGDDSPRAWRWRERFAERAPRPVAESLQGLTTPAAWELRRVLAPTCRETFQSMVGLDGEEAWGLREAYAEMWPSTVCKSLGVLAGTPRGAALIARLLAAHRGVGLLRNATRVGEQARQAVLSQGDNLRAVSA